MFSNKYTTDHPLVRASCFHRQSETRRSEDWNFIRQNFDPRIEILYVKISIHSWRISGGNDLDGRGCARQKLKYLMVWYWTVLMPTWWLLISTASSRFTSPYSAVSIVVKNFPFFYREQENLCAPRNNTLFTQQQAHWSLIMVIHEPFVSQRKCATRLMMFMSDVIVN